MSAPAGTSSSLRQVLLDAISDAIDYQQDKYVFCRDCRNSIVGHCFDHKWNYEQTALYEKAAALIRSAASDPSALASILADLSSEGGAG